MVKTLKTIKIVFTVDIEKIQRNLKAISKGVDSASKKVEEANKNTADSNKGVADSTKRVAKAHDGMADSVRESAKANDKVRTSLTLLGKDLAVAKGSLSVLADVDQWLPLGKSERPRTQCLHRPLPLLLRAEHQLWKVLG